MLDAVPERLARFRETEEISDERLRQMQREGIGLRPMLEDWAQLCRNAFATGEREDLSREFNVQWGATAEEIRIE